MLTVSNVQTSGWQAAIRGMRNPMNSHAKEDSSWGDTTFALGPNDLDLATRLIKAGPEHAKFLRMIHVQMDITAPLYYWKEMDQYRVGTTTNSCSTMHRIAAKEFTLEDFSCEHLLGDYPSGFDYNVAVHDPDNQNNLTFGECFLTPMGLMNLTIDVLNVMRHRYLKTKNKEYWWQLIQLLPSSYNQLRTWDASLATVLSICKQRKGHKLNEWETFRQACFENIPYFNEFYNAMGGNN